MSYPFRENLEVVREPQGDFVRCTRCFHSLSKLWDDWKTNCKRELLPPTKAGPLMDILVGHYVLQKLYCPACGVLLDSDLVEERQGSGGAEDRKFEEKSQKR